MVSSGLQNNESIFITIFLLSNKNPLFLGPSGIINLNKDSLFSEDTDK